MKILILVMLAIMGTITGFASEKMREVDYEYKFKMPQNSDRINLDIPFRKAIKSLGSNQENYRKLSLKITVDFPPMDIATNMESFKELHKIGIERIFFEINDDHEVWSKNFEMKIEGNILSIPRWLIDKRITDKSDEFCELAIEDPIPRYIP